MIREISVELGMDEMVDITDEVRKFVRESGKESGAVLIFSVGSTGAITTIEYEPGLKKDFPRIMNRIAPYGEDYEHHKTWHDDNGSSHVKASIAAEPCCTLQQRGVDAGNLAADSCGEF